MATRKPIMIISLLLLLLMMMMRLSMMMVLHVEMMTNRPPESTIIFTPSPLFNAAMEGHVDVVKVLVKVRAPAAYMACTPVCPYLTPPLRAGDYLTPTCP